MSDRVGIVVATYGDRNKWSWLARRATASAHNQSHPANSVAWVHDETLHQARNKGAEMVGTDWLIFLDADDELDPLYVESMLKATTEAGEGKWIFRPITQGFHEDGTVEEPRMIPRSDLKSRNCAVIGTMCSSELFFQVGGFKDYPVLEDFALWRSMVQVGAGIQDVEDAIYRIYVRSESRNTNDADVYRRILKEIPL